MLIVSFVRSETSTEPAQTDSAHKHVKNSGMECKVLNRDKSRAPGLLEATVLASKRAPASSDAPCGNQHAYTENDRIIRLSTRLIDCEVRYGSKTEGKKLLISQYGGFNIGTGLKQGENACKEKNHLSRTRPKGHIVKRVRYEERTKHNRSGFRQRNAIQYSCRRAREAVSTDP